MGAPDDSPAQFHFDPDSYLDLVRGEIPDFDAFQYAVAGATGAGAGRILELGTGTGETTRRVLARHPAASLVGIDESATMLEEVRARFPADRFPAVHFIVARLQDPFPKVDLNLPADRFDVVVSALAVHHLDGPEKAALFSRVAQALVPKGIFVLGDVVVPDDPAEAQVPLTDGHDKPSTVADQLRWLREAGFPKVAVAWQHRDLAVLVATRPERVW